MHKYKNLNYFIKSRSKSSKVVKVVKAEERKFEAKISTMVNL